MNKTQKKLQNNGEGGLIVSGIARRIDELGRIVIPKEIRRNLRIREGDMLDIYTSNDNIVLKKHSAFNNLEDFAGMLTDSIYKDIKRNIIITDRDKVIAASGKNKKDYLNKNISEELMYSITRREKMLEKHKKMYKICDKEEEMTYTLSTIIVNGDAVGMVMIFDKEGTVSELEKTVASVISNFLEDSIAG